MGGGKGEVVGGGGYEVVGRGRCRTIDGSRGGAMWGMGEAAGRWGACCGGDKEPKEQETVQEALFKNLPNSHLTWSI